MLSEDGAAGRESGALAARRWRAIDSLLPQVPRETPHCGVPLVVRDGDLVVATGQCEHWAAEPGSLELSWGAARRFQLSATVADPERDALGRLLVAWREHLADVPGTGEADTAALVNWPSRDAAGIVTLLRHGLNPLEVIAARAMRRPVPWRRPTVPDGGVLTLDRHTLIRRAGPADVETVARLGTEVVRFDAQFGKVNERPDTLAAMRREAVGLLAGPEPWTWLAERDGKPVGLLAAQRPADAAWIAPMTSTAPAAYLDLMFVEPGERAVGLGSALVDEFHRAAEGDGVAVILLHYEQLNPFSMPFWSRHGYRPLWTTWSARAIH
jgi:GNAT superfamily N-acetyltransferase